MPSDLFSKTSLPETVPAEMQKAIDELKGSSSQEKCLRRAYEILSAKYRGYRVKTYLRLPEVLIKDVDCLWKKSGFLHCTNMNYLLRIFLVRSGFFKEDDIRLRWTLVWGFSPHQYVQVKVDDAWINVDIWARAHGIQFGDYLRGFH